MTRNTRTRRTTKIELERLDARIAPSGFTYTPTPPPGVMLPPGPSSPSNPSSPTPGNPSSPVFF